MVAVCLRILPFILILLNNVTLAYAADAPLLPAPSVFANQELQLRVSNEPAGQVLQIRGVLYPQDAPLVAQAVALLKAGVSTTVVMTNFGGGTYGPIMTLKTSLDAICSKAKGCLLQTLVKKGQICASNCITLFMAGEKRLASEGAIFGFHEATNGGVPEAGACERAYATAGVAPAWLKAHPELFATTTITRLNPDHMMGSNIVNKIIRDVTNAEQR